MTLYRSRYVEILYQKKREFHYCNDYSCRQFPKKWILRFYFAKHADLSRYSLHHAEKSWLGGALALEGSVEFNEFWSAGDRQDDFPDRQ